MSVKVGKKGFDEVDEKGGFVKTVIHPNQLDLSDILEREGDVVLLIDGDIVAYRSSAAADGRLYAAGAKTFKYKKDAVAYCEEEGLDPVATIKLDYIPESEANATSNVDKVYGKLKKVFFKELRGRKKVTTETYLTPPATFRSDVKSDYKANRRGMRKPHHLIACKDHLRSTRGALEVENYEADDLLSIRALELWREGKIPVICTLDKDLDQVEGFHYNWTKNLLYFTTRDESLRCLYKQLLTGDKTDNIPGIPRVGKKTADNIVDAIPEDSEEVILYNTVLNEYLCRFECEDGEDEKDFFKRIIQMVTQNMRLLYLCRRYEDLWNPPLSSE